MQFKDVRLQLRDRHSVETPEAMGEPSNTKSHIADGKCRETMIVIVGAVLVVRLMQKG